MEKLIEKQFYCWREGRDEGEARMIKSETAKEAARMAVDTWHHENVLDLSRPTVKVFVKDMDDNTQVITITQDFYRHHEEPRA